MIYIVLNHPPNFSSGGIGSVVREIICNIDIDKKDITLVCNGIDDDMESFCGVPVVNLRVQRYKIFDFIFLYSQIVFSFKLFLFLKENIKTGDVVNIHEGNGISFFLNLLCKRIKKEFTIITTIHGLITVYYINLIKNLPLKYIFVKILFLIILPYYWFIEKIYLMNSDYIVNISHKTKRIIKTYYRKMFNSVVIVNGMTTNVRVGKKKNKIKVKNAIIVGSVTYPKGLDIAIESVIKFNKNKEEKINLNIVGFHDFYKYYSKEALPECIRYVGKVDYVDMGKQYEKNDFLLFPSRSEEFASLVVLEALQWKLPIIVSKECNINEIKGYNNFGYQIKTWDVNDWVEAIDKISVTDEYMQKKEYIEKYDFSIYNWKNIAKEYKKLFDNCL